MKQRNNLPQSTFDLNQQLEEAREAIAAQLVLLADASGNLLACIPAHPQIDPLMLAAIAAGYLAAAHEITQLTNIGDEAAASQMLTIEGQHGCAILYGNSARDLILAVILGPDSVLGLARLTIRRLTETLQVELEANPQQLATDDLDYTLLNALNIDL